MKLLTRNRKIVKVTVPYKELLQKILFFAIVNRTLIVTENLVDIALCK